MLLFLLSSHDLSFCSYLCATGKYNPVAGQVECLFCQPGRYRSTAMVNAVSPFVHAGSSTDEYAGKCHLCPAGQFQDQSNQGGCKPCTTGMSQTQAGQTSCDSCIAGKYRGALDAPDQACVDCSAGTYTDLSGAGSCLDCIIGQSQVVKGQTSCQSCTPGHYRGSSDSASKACLECVAGTYIDTVDAGSCLPCIPGRAQSAKAATECKLCSKHQYTDIIQQTKCKFCIAGTYTKSTESTSCTDCGAGQFSVSNVCERCPQGWKRGDQNKNLTQCVQCKRGEMTMLSGSTACSKCDAGMYGSSPSVCTTCVPGRFQDGKGTHQCKNCPKDTFNTVFSAKAKAECQKCGSAYAPFTGTANKTGVNSSSGCVCLGANPEAATMDALRGYYQVSGAEFDNELEKPPAFRKICLPVPEGLDCDRDGMTLEELTAFPGFMRPDITNTEVADCKNQFTTNAPYLAESRCCPIDPMTNVSICKLTVSKEQCSDPYGGPECGACRNKSYVAVGKSCIYCAPGASILKTMASTFSLLFIVFLVFVVIFYKAGRKKKKKEKKQDANITNGNDGDDDGDNEDDQKARDKKEAQTRQIDAASRLVADQAMIQRNSTSTAPGAGSGGTETVKGDTQIIFDRIKVVWGWCQIFGSLTITIEIAWVRC